MAERELAEGAEKRPYFQAVEAARPEQDDGTREMGDLYPFLISGGSNTERYYFMHINDTTDYKFNIRPRYFGDESSYTEVFPRRIMSNGLRRDLSQSIHRSQDIDLFRIR